MGKKPRFRRAIGLEQAALFERLSLLAVKQHNVRGTASFKRFLQRARSKNRAA